MGLETDWSSFRRLYLDAVTIIYAYEKVEPFTGLLFQLFQQMGSGNLIAVTSELTLAEVLIKHIRNESEKMQRIYLEAFSIGSGVSGCADFNQILGCRSQDSRGKSHHQIA